MEHTISTHTPLAGCNKNSWKKHERSFNFYSHTPCGVQRYLRLFRSLLCYFYSHTPCGVQHYSYRFTTLSKWFLLTHPLRGATKTWYANNTTIYISTHTPLAGCNQDYVVNLVKLKDFYSHTPCGVQRWCGFIFIPYKIFLLTHPLRGATQSQSPSPSHRQFLLTHPLRGATRSSYTRWKCCWFLLTHPLRGATIMKIETVYTLKISTHTPLAGCNSFHPYIQHPLNYFYSHTPCGAQLKFSKTGKE